MVHRILGVGEGAVAGHVCIMKLEYVLNDHSLDL